VADLRGKSKNGNCEKWKSIPSTGETGGSTSFYVRLLLVKSTNYNTLGSNLSLGQIFYNHLV
jgi:hypothetical protein